MAFSTFGITALSLAGCICLVYMAGLPSRMLLSGVFAGIWVAAAFARGVWSVLIYPHYVSPLRKLPTARGSHWLLGHGRSFLAAGKEPAREWINTIPHDGLVRYFWFFNKERVLVSSNKGLAEVLVTKSYQFKRPDIVRRLLERVLGVGILLTEGDVHKAQRRNLMPAFAFRHVKDLYPVFWGKAREVLQAMTLQADGDGVAHLNALDWANRCTLDIIGVAGLGVDFGSIRDPSSPLAVTYKSLMGEHMGSGLMGLLHVLFPSWLVNILPTSRNRTVERANRVLRRTCQDLIRDKKRKMADDKTRTDVDILSVALESGLFSDDNLVDQLMTFLAAGHDTTASALTWATYLLACHPDVQTRLRSEIRDNLPPLHDDKATITSTEIDRLPYLNAVCNEVLRLLPPVPRTTREAIEDTTIQGQHIPKGTIIMLSPWATNVDHKLWGDDAQDFRPERWLADGGGGATSNYASLTFLHGPRSCIGASFARAELACLLGAWVGRFNFELQDPDMMQMKTLDIRYGVTATPRGGLHVRATVLDGF